MGLPPMGACQVSARAATLASTIAATAWASRANFKGQEPYRVIGALELPQAIVGPLCVWSERRGILSWQRGAGRNDTASREHRDTRYLQVREPCFCVGRVRTDVQGTSSTAPDIGCWASALHTIVQASSMHSLQIH